MAFPTAQAMRCNASRASTSVPNDKFTTGCPCGVRILNPKAGPSCPDTAILATVVEERVLEEQWNKLEQPELRSFLQEQFVTTNKYHDLPVKRGETGGAFGL